jgi:hypothetical protein
VSSVKSIVIFVWITMKSLVLHIMSSSFFFLMCCWIESLFYFVREWILGCPLRLARCSPWFSDRCFPRRGVCFAFSPARVLFFHSSGADQISARGELLEFFSTAQSQLLWFGFCARCLLREVRISGGRSAPFCRWGADLLLLSV